MVTDNQLIEKYRHGDEKAFDILYERYRKPLYSYINGLCPGQPDKADDLYQQAWVRIIAHLPRYRDSQRFLAWGMRIAHNLAMDGYRRNARFREVVDVSELVDPATHDAPLPMEREELRDALAVAVAQLPVAQREVFLLRQQDVSFREIARIQKTSINTSLGRMRYAVLKLQEQLADWRV